ncbi:MAG: LacI family transcriptional regulator, partial [Lachnospiraceae bacterium]|nr:LacI family transcriptional regulator [Lachnospiraceae bacterium]
GIEIGDYIHPKLTTNLQPARKVAEKIFELLYDLVNENCGNRNLIFKGELLEKESVRDLNKI